jgi:hypothetical protein
MHEDGQRCTDLIEMTANVLSESLVTLMLLAVQKDNLELNIKQAVKWYVSTYSMTKVRRASSHHRAHSAFKRGDGGTERIIKLCILAFPSIWVSFKPCPELSLAKRTLSTTTRIPLVRPYLFMSHFLNRLFNVLIRDIPPSLAFTRCLDLFLYAL